MDIPNEKQYKQRQKKTWANYRAKAIQLARSYERFEKDYVPPELHQKVKGLITEFGLDKSADIDTEIASDIVKYSDLIKAVAELNVSIILAKEVFLIDNDFANAKTLCEISYEDCDLAKILESEDYEAVREFLLETFSDFFTNHVLLTLSGARGKKSLTTETTESQT